MKRILAFLKTNQLKVIVCLALFLIPFFWFKNGEVDYGGDASRLYFYNPFSSVVNYFLYDVNPSNSLGSEVVLYSLVPFLFLLTFLKKIFFENSFFLNNFFNGFLLSGGFLSIYLIVKELIPKKEGEAGAGKEFSCIFSGLFFIFSPLTIYNWERALEAINQVFIYPLVFFLFLKYLNSQKKVYLISLAVTTFIFSINFNFGASSWLFAFFPFMFVFLFFYSVINHKSALFIKGLLISIILFILINFFHLFPQIISLSNPGDSNVQMIFSKSQMENRGLVYFLSVQPHIRLAYNLLNQPPFVIAKGYGHQFENAMYNFGVKNLYLFFIYPILICIGIVFYHKETSLLRKKLFNLILIIFLILLFLMTANITNMGLEIYKMMFYVPGFQMFRSFYTKFAYSYIFFYSLLLGFSIELILNKLVSVWKKRLLMFFLITLVLFNGWPLISGKILNPVLMNSKSVRAPTVIDPAYEEFIKEVNAQNFDLKVLSLPIATENYQILQGKNGGAYLGPSSLSFLTGKKTFGGINRFSIYWPQIEKLIERGQYSELKKLFGYLNIGYIFHNNDKYIYDNFPSNPFSDWLKKYFPSQQAISEFVKKLDAKEIISIKSYKFYVLDDLLPHFYIPTKYLYANRPAELFSKIIDDKNFDQRSVIISKTDVFPGNKDIFNSFFIKNNEQSIKGGEYLSFSNIDSCREVFYPTVKKRSVMLKKVVRLKENLEEFLVGHNPSKLIDKKIYFANKRLNEAVTFENEYQNNIILYEIKIKQAISLIKRIGKENRERFDLAFRLRHNLKENLLKLGNSSLPNRDRWQKSIENFIVDIENNFDVNDFKKNNIIVDLPYRGQYSIFLKGKNQQETQEIIEDISTLSLVDEKHNFINRVGKNEMDKDGWFLYGKETFLSGKTTFQVSIGNKELSNNSFKSRGGIWYEIKGITQKRAKVQLRREDNQDIFREFCSDPQDGTFDFFMESPSVESTVNILGNFEEVSVTPLLNPEILLVNEKGNSDIKVIPEISFVKINPTKYKIRVKQAKEAFSLVFSESFHSGWKLYLSDSKLNSDKYFDNILTSYFNGKIKEGNHQNIFLDRSTFETWTRKPIAQNKHYLTNDYANSWYITPSDVDNKTDYELIVEFVPQRLFYIGLFVSVTVFLFCLLFLMRKFARMLKNVMKN